MEKLNIRIRAHRALEMLKDWPGPLEVRDIIQELLDELPSVKPESGNYEERIRRLEMIFGWKPEGK